MRIKPLLLLLVICPWLPIAPLAKPAELKKETVEGWNEYIAKTKARRQPRLDGQKHFLWIDDLPEQRRRVRQGEILVQPAAGDGEFKVPDGLIHDWIGTAYVPEAKLKDVFAVVNDYDHYQEYYQPEVVQSKLIRHTGNEYRFSLRLVKKVLFVTAVIDGKYESYDFRLGDKRCYSYAFSTRVNDVDDYGKPGEHQLPEGTGSGYIWRLYSFSKLEETDGGVYIEFEALGLSRDVPFLLHWLVNPIIRRLSRNSLQTVLEKTRKFTLEKAGKTQAGSATALSIRQRGAGLFSKFEP